MLLEKNAEMGVIKYSNAELTALDLVQYADRVGSFSSVATVLAELREATNFADARNASFKFTGHPWQSKSFVEQDLIICTRMPKRSSATQ